MGDSDDKRHSSDGHVSSGEEFSDAVDMVNEITLECPVTDCSGGTGGAVCSCTAEPACAAALLQVHGYSHRTAPATAQVSDRRARPPTLQLPKLEGQCSESRYEDWKLE